jgi:hypothetical protein
VGAALTLLWAPSQARNGVAKGMGRKYARMTREGGLEAYAENPSASALKNSAENLMFTMSEDTMPKPIDCCIARCHVMGR